MHLIFHFTRNDVKRRDKFNYFHSGDMALNDDDQSCRNQIFDKIEKVALAAPGDIDIPLEVSFQFRESKKGRITL